MLCLCPFAFTKTTVNIQGEHLIKFLFRNFHAESFGSSLPAAGEAETEWTFAFAGGRRKR